LFCSFDLLDLAILLGVIACSIAIAFYDFKFRSFPVWLLLLLVFISIAWCLKQKFTPVSILPIGLAMIVVALINHYFTRIIGNGDIFLFLISGVFVPVYRISTFVMLCGIIGVCTSIAMRTRIIPFSFVILFSMMLTFSLDLISLMSSGD
jgi:Flp pilus assembly protein protease CpaA